MKYIFDLDGTLYPLNMRDQENHTHNPYFKAVSKHTGLSMAESEEIALRLYRKYGDSLRGFKEENLYSLEVIRAIAHDIPSYITYENFVFHCPQTEKLLSTLPGRVVVQSNGVREHVNQVLTRLKLHPYVEEYFGSDDVGFLSKPNPQSFSQVLDSMGWYAEDVVFIEDKLTNLEGAKKMGFETVHVGRGENQYDESHSHYVDRAYPTVLEFLEAEISKEPSHEL